MDGSLFSRFYSICETKLEDSAVLGNILKTKTKIPKTDFPSFTGFYFSEYTMCFILMKKIQ